MKKITNFLKSNLYLLILGFTTFWLRIVNLGYSDYQGDEIKALFLPEKGQPIYEFLLTQRKGPVQFLVTFILKFFDPTYNARFFMRLPFALAGILSVFFFYKLIQRYFSKKIAFFSSFFLATNGFFIAFSRIIQYQSFVILFMILALYFFTLASKDESWKVKGLYFGFLAWALSILSHYDGVFIAPLVLYTFYAWIKKYEIRKVSDFLRFFTLPSLIFVLLLCSFYIPFVSKIDDSTLSYWKGRIEGTGGKISSSKYLFTVYQPIYVIHIYTSLAFLGGIRILLKLYQNCRKRNLDRIILYVAVGLWFAIPLAFLEFFVNIPGTHIYTYLIGLFLILGFGVAFIWEMLDKVLGKITFVNFLFWLGTSVVFFFIFAQSHQIFVEHGTEYPWKNEKFFIWTFPKPSPTYHLSIFGFPYYRHWDEISGFVRSSKNTGYYSTNERKSIARYHIPFDKNTEKAGHFIYIKDPQSFTNEIIYEKAAYWADNYPPILSFYKNGDTTVKVYYMPEGSLEDIIEEGY